MNSPVDNTLRFRAMTFGVDRDTDSVTVGFEMDRAMTAEDCLSVGRPQSTTTGMECTLSTVSRGSTAGTVASKRRDLRPARLTFRAWHAVFVSGCRDMRV